MVWQSLRQRATNASAKRSKDYVGRGIGVCERWASFSNFLADMGPVPTGCTLERKDNNADYGPTNCCWATPKAQQRNKRTNRIVNFAGVSLPACDWADKVGMKPNTLIQRLRHGWPVEQALTVPLRCKRVPR